MMTSRLWLTWWRLTKNLAIVCVILTLFPYCGEAHDTTNIGTVSELSAVQRSSLEEIAKHVLTHPVHWFLVVDASYSYLDKETSWRSVSHRLDSVLAELPLRGGDTIDLSLFGGAMASDVPSIQVPRHWRRDMSLAPPAQFEPDLLAVLFSSDWGAERRKTEPLRTRFQTVMDALPAMENSRQASSNSEDLSAKQDASWELWIVVTDGCKDQEEAAKWPESFPEETLFLLDDRHECDNVAEVFRAGESPNLHVVRWDGIGRPPAVARLARFWLFRKAKEKAQHLETARRVQFPARISSAPRIPVYWLQWGRPDLSPAVSYRSRSDGGSPQQGEEPGGKGMDSGDHVASDTPLNLEGAQRLLLNRAGLRIYTDTVKLPSGDGTNGSVRLPGDLKVSFSEGDERHVVALEAISIDVVPGWQELKRWLSYRGRFWALMAFISMVGLWIARWQRLMLFKMKLDEFQPKDVDAGQKNNKQDQEDSSPKDYIFPNHVGSEGFRFMLPRTKQQEAAKCGQEASVGNRMLARRKEPPSHLHLYGPLGNKQLRGAISSFSPPSRWILDFFPFLGSGYWILWAGFLRPKLSSLETRCDLVTPRVSQQEADRLNGVLFRPFSPWLRYKGTRARVLPFPDLPAYIKGKNNRLAWFLRVEEGVEAQKVEGDGPAKAGSLKRCSKQLWRLLCLYVDRLLWLLTVLLSAWSLRDLLAPSFLDERLYLFLSGFVAVTCVYLGLMRWMTSVSLDEIQERKHRRRWVLAYKFSFLPPMTLYTLVATVCVGEFVAHFSPWSPLASVCLIGVGTILTLVFLTFIKDHWVRRRVEHMKGFGFPDLLLELLTGSMPWGPS